MDPEMLCYSIHLGLLKEPVDTVTAWIVLQASAGMKRLIKRNPHLPSV